MNIQRTKYKKFLVFLKDCWCFEDSSASFLLALSYRSLSDTQYTSHYFELEAEICGSTRHSTMIINSNLGDYVLLGAWLRWGKLYIIRILVGVILEQREVFVKIIYYLYFKEEIIRMESVRRGKEYHLQQVYLLCWLRAVMPENLCFRHW